MMWSLLSVLKFVIRFVEIKLNRFTDVVSPALGKLCLSSAGDFIGTHGETEKPMSVLHLCVEDGRCSCERGTTCCQFTFSRLDVCEEKRASGCQHRLADAEQQTSHPSCWTPVLARRVPSSTVFAQRHRQDRPELHLQHSTGHWGHDDTLYSRAVVKGSSSSGNHSKEKKRKEKGKSRKKGPKKDERMWQHKSTS